MGKLEYNVFIDLDGVLADFDKRVQEITGKKSHEHTQKSLWVPVAPLIGQDVFWQSLEKMPNADKLWNGVIKLTGKKPTVLSAGGTNYPELTVKAKTEWARNHFHAEDVIVVVSAKDKAKYAHPRAILIDDSPRAINPWVQSGGIGIFHHDVDKSLRELDELLEYL